MIFSKIKKIFLLTLGTISLILGVIGIFLPVLPTTPFLLLTAFCYVRSSERLYNWLMNHEVLGKYIYNYLTHRAATKKTKISAITFMWAGTLLSIYLVGKIHFTIFIIIIGIGVTIHLLKLNTLDE